MRASDVPTVPTDVDILDLEACIAEERDMVRLVKVARAVCDAAHDAADAVAVAAGCRAIGTKWFPIARSAAHRAITDALSLNLA